MQLMLRTKLYTEVVKLSLHKCVLLHIWIGLDVDWVGAIVVEINKELTF